MSTSLKNSAKAVSPSPAGVRWGLGAALISALAAGLCCAAPLVYLLFGVSAAALTGLNSLGWLQIPMGLLALLCLGAVFFRLYLSKRPLCTRSMTRTWLQFSFWLVALLVLALLSYPFVLPWLLD